MRCNFIPLDGQPGKFICINCRMSSARNKRYGLDGPPSRRCPDIQNIYPIAERLATEIMCSDIILDNMCYYISLISWEKSNFPIRDVEDQKTIITIACPRCKYYDQLKKVCNRCGAKGQLIIAKAYMETDFCPIANW